MNLSPKGRQALPAKPLLFPCSQLLLPEITSLSGFVSPPPHPPVLPIHLLKSHHLWGPGGLPNLWEACFLHMHSHNQLRNTPLVPQWVLALGQGRYGILFWAVYVFICLHDEILSSLATEVVSSPSCISWCHTHLRYFSHNTEKADTAGLPWGRPIGINPCQQKPSLEDRYLYSSSLHQDTPANAKLIQGNYLSKGSEKWKG